jgi:DNA-binding IclR family transcriptional regulator
MEHNRPRASAPAAAAERPAQGSAPAAPSGSQTLFRGLDVLEIVAETGAITLPQLSERLGLTRSTVHRLAGALVERRMLMLTPRAGYSLGPKLLELGDLARQQMDLPRLARPHLERLWTQLGDTIHLGVLEENRALYLDKLTGRRRINISSSVGERQPIRSTGLGKALILDESEARWREFYSFEESGKGGGRAAETKWIESMRRYAGQGYAFDLEENEDRIRCVAAPVRNAVGKIVAAISVSGAAQYMDDERMKSIAVDITGAAQAIARELGWKEDRQPSP